MPAAKFPPRGRLFGLQLQDLTADLSDALGVPGGQGVVVSDVDEEARRTRPGFAPEW